jgi:heat shock protein HslJ
MKLLPLLLLILAAGAAGCDDDSPLSPTTVTNVTWKLETIERVGSPTISVPNPEQYTLRMEDDGRVLVRADCNTCSGRYTLSGSSLSLNSVACTKAFCTLASLDGNYAAALERIQSVTITGSQLVVRGSDFTLRFRG